MNRLKIGIRLESLELPLRRGLQEAERMGAAGVRVDAVGALSPANLGQTGRRELRHLLRSHNLELTALGCPLRRGLDSAEEQEARIDHVKKVLVLSYDLEARIAIVQAGQIPGEETDHRFPLLREALLALGQHGDRVGAVLALETGLDAGSTLRQFLNRFDTGGLGVNFDPANLLLHDFDPYDSAIALGERIVHAHAKDARPASASRAGQEVPLGHGDIDWLRLLSVLEEIGYHGWLVVEQETGANRLAGVTAGVAFLRRLVG